MKNGGHVNISSAKTAGSANERKMKYLLNQIVPSNPYVHFLQRAVALQSAAHQCAARGTVVQQGLVAYLGTLIELW